MPRGKQHLEVSGGRKQEEDSSVVAQLLGIRHDASGNPLPPRDFWVRGQDLTAVYEPGDGRLLRITAMWRRQGDLHFGGDGQVAIWQLVLSAQTAALASDPSVAVVARIPRGSVIARFNAPIAGGVPEPLRGHADCLGALVEGAQGFAVLVAMHPIDTAAIHRAIPAARDLGQAAGRPEPEMFQIARLAPEGPGVVLTCRLFNRPLEKGVLLRGRVLAAIGPAGGDGGWASEALRAFGQEPALLST